MKILSTAVVLLFVFSAAYAQIPGAISYQGIIIDPVTGETAADGIHKVKLSFYDTSSGGNSIWETSDISVTSFKGLFTTIIPIPTNANWDSQLYAQITVDGVVLATRVQLTTVPYAFKAQVANSMDAAGLVGTISDQRLSSHLQDLADGTLSGSKVGAGINAARVDNGVLPNTVLDSDLQDLADGTLSGSKVGAGINAAMVDNGVLPNTVLDSDLQDLADDGVLTATRMEDLNANKIVAGTFDPARIPELDAAKINSGVFETDRIPNLNASKITAGTLAPGVLPTNLVTGTGVAGQLAFWSGTQQLLGDGLYWDQAENEFGINDNMPDASFSVVHDNSHMFATSMRVFNSSSSSLGSKTGIDISLTSNPNTSVYGIDLSISTVGSGEKRGVNLDVSSTNFSANNIYGVFTNAFGLGTGAHYGVYAESTSTSTGTNTGVTGYVDGSGTGTKTGVKGQALGSGNTKYGVYGTATGAGTNNYGIYGTASGGSNNYAVYSQGDLFVQGNVRYTGILIDESPSDKKLKKDIRKMPPSLSKILLLNPTNYYFRKNEFIRLDLPEKKQNGLIAQEVEKIFPELITEKKMEEIRDEKGSVEEAELSFRTLDYTSLIPILIKGMQEQQAMIEELKAEVKKLKSSNAAQESKPRLVKTSLNK